MGHMKLHNDTVMQGGDGTIAIQSEPVQNEAPQTVTDLEEVIFVVSFVWISVFFQIKLISVVK